jgi:hypothetical protein
VTNAVVTIPAGNYNSTTSVVNWEIFNNGDFATIGTIKSNTINSNTGAIISSTSIWNYKSSGGSTYILLESWLMCGTFHYAKLLAPK